MIKITNKSDLDGLDKLKIPDVFRKYIKEYYNEMLLRFGCESLFGEKEGWSFSVHTSASGRF